MEWTLVNLHFLSNNSIAFPLMNLFLDQFVIIIITVIILTNVIVKSKSSPVKVTPSICNEILVESMKTENPLYYKINSVQSFTYICINVYANYWSCKVGKGVIWLQEMQREVGEGEFLHIGQVAWSRSHGSTHLTWKRWPQWGNTKSMSVSL